MSNAETQTDPTHRLWCCLAEYLRYGFALFGKPSELAQRVWLSRTEHKLICDFLRPLEELLRRLVFIAALHLSPLAPARVKETKRRERATMQAAFGAGFDPDNPETWRVSIRLSADMDRRRLAGQRRRMRNTLIAPSPCPLPLAGERVRNGKRLRCPSSTGKTMGERGAHRAMRMEVVVVRSAWCAPRAECCAAGGNSGAFLQSREGPCVRADKVSLLR
jgi:hypothetical protein